MDTGNPLSRSLYFHNCMFPILYASKNFTSFCLHILLPPHPSAFTSFCLHILLSPHPSAFTSFCLHILLPSHHVPTDHVLTDHVSSSLSFTTFLHHFPLPLSFTTFLPPSAPTSQQVIFRSRNLTVRSSLSQLISSGRSITDIPIFTGCNSQSLSKHAMHGRGRESLSCSSSIMS
jgi:hypothetical protein